MLVLSFIPQYGGGRWDWLSGVHHRLFSHSYPHFTVSRPTWEGLLLSKNGRNGDLLCRLLGTSSRVPLSGFSDFDNYRCISYTYAVEYVPLRALVQNKAAGSCASGDTVGSPSWFVVVAQCC